MSQELKRQLEENRQKFLSAISQYRPKLHRYCSRMAGSVFDGEDLVQETLAQAYYKLSQLKQDLPIEPWLFRIAHNKCIDFLRKQKITMDCLDSIENIEDSTIPEYTEEVEQAVTILVTDLPAMERASLILKDILGYSLLEIAEIVGTNEGAVKSALHRARTKLQKTSPINRKTISKSMHTKLISLYVDRFNERDWKGLCELISQDAKLEVVGTAEVIGNKQIEMGYLGNYRKLEIPWYFTCGYIDGQNALICWRYINNLWMAKTAIIVKIVDDKITFIKDYIYAEYLLEDAAIKSDNPHRENI